MSDVTTYPPSPCPLSAGERGWKRAGCQTGDTWLVALAHAHAHAMLGTSWMLFLARLIVQDHSLPWQKVQTCLTPQRVCLSMWTIFVQIGTAAQPPKPRGKPPGWLMDELTAAQRSTEQRLDRLEIELGKTHSEMSNLSSMLGAH